MMPNSLAARVDPAAAVRIEHLQRADRGQDGRDAQLLAQEGGRRIDVGDVDQDARSECDAVEGEPIPTECRLRFRAADQVVPRALIQATAGFPNEFLVADEIESQAKSLPRYRC